MEPYDAAREAARQRMIVAYRARFAVVKGYVQLLVRQANRPDIAREQLAAHCAVLDRQLQLLEDLARQLLYDVPRDEILEESVKPPRHDADGMSF